MLSVRMNEMVCPGLLGLIFIVIAFTTNVLAQNCDPIDEFPTVSDSDPSQCDGVGQIVVNDGTGGYEAGTFRWETTGTLGSQCWQQLFLAPNYYEDEDFEEIQPDLEGGSNASSNRSTCGFSFYDQYYLNNGNQIYNNGSSNYPFGFRSKFNVLTMPGLGTFLPPAEHMSESSVALLPPGAADKELSWNGSSRATLHNQVDFVTGMPLQQANELEIPFDGATFRLIRTRSGSRDDMQKQAIDSVNYGGLSDRVYANESWWDWAGQGWMISENPLLLVDSSMPGPVGPQPVTTYLVLDAHHTIPFQQIESTGQYAAPPRFKARLEHNGVWDSSSGDWERFDADGNGIDENDPRLVPTQYDIYLYDGELKYSFVVVREDMPENRWGYAPDTNDKLASYHNRPILPHASADFDGHDPYDHCHNPGFGLPYIGLCFKIEDRFGHEVKINYSDVKSQPLDLGDDSDSCVECSQSCQKKGMISSIELVSQGETLWTLLYSYRGMYVHSTPGHDTPLMASQYPESPNDPNYDPTNPGLYNDMWGGYHIDRIHVIDRVLTANEFAEVQAGLTVDHRDSFALDVDESAPSSFVDTQHLSVLDNEWLYRIRNHYMPNQIGGMWRVGLKVMTTVTDRAYDADSGQLDDVGTQSRWVYHYEITESSSPAFPGPNWPPAESSWSIRWLSRMYTPDDIDQLLTFWMSDPASRSDKPDDYIVHNSESEVLDRLVRVKSIQEPVSNSALDAKSASYASGQWTKHTWFSWENEGTNASPKPNALITSGSHGQFITRDFQRIHSDNYKRTVRAVSVRDETGQKRHYQINRVRMSPYTDTLHGNFGQPGAMDPAGNNSIYFANPHHFVAAYNYHQRSVFYAPFKWQHVKDGQSTTSYVGLDTPNLTEPRWIVIVDEFSNSVSQSTYRYGEATGTETTSSKPGQLSRRVVEMSASGHVLTDRLWEFTEDGIVRSGGGLGEQFLYQRAEDYFNEDGLQDTNFPPKPQNGGDPLSVVRDEPLLVEYRSVGYSVESDKDTGLTRFIDYSMFNPEGETLQTYFDQSDESEDLIPLIQRIQPVAEGIRRGVSVSDFDMHGNPLGESVHPKLYKSQTFRSDTNPIDVLGAVEFVNPTQSSSLLSVMPDIDQLSSNAVPNQDYRILYTVIERDFSTEAMELPEHERDVLSRMVVGVPKQVFPGSEYYYPVEREFYDPDTGYTIWSCTGQLRDPNLPAGFSDPHESLIFTYYERDRDGQSIHTVLDADVSVGGIVSANPHSPDPITYHDQYGTANSWPSTPETGQWQRLSQTPALQYVTSYEYDRRYGLIDAFFEGGRRWAKRVIRITGEEAGVDWDQGMNREFIFNDLEQIIVDSSLVWVTNSEGEVNDYKRNTGRTQHPPTSKRRVRFGSIPTLTNGDIRVSSNHRPEWVVKNSIKMALDANGRLQEARLLERSANGQLLAVGTKQINDLGALYREQEIDGSVTIQTRNALGQTLRTYKGTLSGDPFGIGEQGAPDNMVLVNRTQYGTSANDAWLPTVVRRYQRTDWWHDEPYESIADSQDGSSMPTTFSYDWQNRAVRTDTYARGVLDQAGNNYPQRLSTTLTYLDFSDRPYLEVVYGADPEPDTDDDPTTPEDESAPLNLGGIDPAEYSNGAYFDGHESHSPDVGQFVRGLFKPISVNYTIYSLNGTAVERRQYDIASLDSGSPQYQASYSYNGMGGQQVYSQSPGAPIGFAVLDGLGRVAVEYSMEPNAHLVHGETVGPEGLKQLSTTEYGYDADGNVVEVINWVRTQDDQVFELTGSNAVRTRTKNWYNAQKQLIATADLGAENLLEGFKTPTSIPTDAYETPPAWNFTNGDFYRNGVPDYALITLNEYDEDGNMTRTVNPNGIATTYEYSNTNRLLYKTENADADDFDDMLMTAYRYQYGRLISMSRVTQPNAVLPPPVTGDLPELAEGGYTDLDMYGDVELHHTTGVQYGAQVVNLNGAGTGYTLPASLNNSMVGALFMPDPDTGEMSDTADVILRYTKTGLIAERFDSAGGAFRYFYDEFDRLIEVETGYWDPSEPEPGFQGQDVGGHQGHTFAPDGVIPDMDEPTDKIGFIEYVYDDRSQLAEVIAWTERDEATRSQIARSLMEYDDRGMMLTERQRHGVGAVDDPKVPKTSYEWSYEPTSNSSAAPVGHHRLSAIEYPVPQPSANARRLTFEYGSPGSVDDLLSRITGINGSIGTVHIADFSYMGDGRRTSTSLAKNRITNDYRLTGTVGGLAGHDMFGRMSEEHWIDSSTGVGSGSKLYQGEYGFDMLGNRITARIKQVDLYDVGAGISHVRDNTRSTLSAYDDLNRLISVQIGQLDEDQGGNTIASMVGGSIQFEDSWNLDALGNWVADLDQSGSTILAHGRESDGFLEHFNYAPGISTLEQADVLRTIDQDVTWRDLISVITDTTTIDGTSNTVGGDPSGLVPIYDGAGRLRFDGQYSYQYDTWGRLVQVNHASPTTVNGEPSYLHLDLVKQYVYDGVGRLIRTTSPLEDNPGELRTVDFYYDGVRIIQEIINDPVQSAAAALNSSDPGLQILAGQTTPSGKDTSTATMGLQGGQLDPQPLSRNIHREYVWGPGDGGVDEILLQTDENDDEYWCIQDAGRDLVALAVRDGHDVSLVRQWTYSPYGEVLTSDHLGASIESHIGHKGLFLDRLDAPVTMNTDESPRLVPQAHASYHNRNRTYQPGLGRFLQMDPNASGMALMSASASHGSGIAALGIAFSMQGMLGDGMNLYQYLGSNPWTRSDPMGLSWDPFEMVDEYLAEWAGSTAAFMDRLGNSAHAVAVVAATVASYMPFPAVGIAGQLALAMLNGETLTLDVILESAFYGILPGGAGKLAPLIKKLGGKVFSSAAQTSIHYASAGGTAFSSAGKAGLIALKAGNILKRGSEAARRWLLKGPRNTFVYLADRGSSPVYVGITKQSRTKRLNQHNKKGKGFHDLTEVTRRMPRNAARAIEQAIILANPEFENKIGSISSLRPVYNYAVVWAQDFAKRRGIQLAY